jgi:hypothetical protein
VGNCYRRGGDTFDLRRPTSIRVRWCWVKHWVREGNEGRLLLYPIHIREASPRSASPSTLGDDGADLPNDDGCKTLSVRGGGGSRPVPVVQAYEPKRKVPTTAPIPINDFDDVESWIRLVSEDVAGVLAGAAEPDEPTSDTSRAPWRK